MNTSSDINSEKPKIVQALLAGFNTIANKPYLILLPILLDLFLWFGPGWRVDPVFQPFLESLSTLPGMDAPEYTSLLDTFQELWQDILTNFNLAVTLRTFPIGVPSLMISKTSFLNPLGRPQVLYLNSSAQVLGLGLVFILIGLALGSLYFQKISQQVLDKGEKSNFKAFLKTFFQVVLMPILLLIILFILSIPLVFLIAMVTMISPSISQFVTMIALVMIIWIIMPLIFTPHGIFLYRQNLIEAMMTSINVVRVSMSQTAWFILASFVLIQGLDYLWLAPNVDDWFLLVGILGHAFIVTAVTAASFHYFIDATRFTQTVMNKQLKTNVETPFKNQE